MLLFSEITAALGTYVALLRKARSRRWISTAPIPAEWYPDVEVIVATPTNP
jgi:hypothetical protein